MEAGAGAESKGKLQPVVEDQFAVITTQLAELMGVPIGKMEIEQDTINISSSDKDGLTRLRDFINKAGSEVADFPLRNISGSSKFIEPSKLSISKENLGVLIHNELRSLYQKTYKGSQTSTYPQPYTIKGADKCSALRIHFSTRKLNQRIRPDWLKSIGAVEVLVTEKTRKYKIPDPEVFTFPNIRTLLEKTPILENALKAQGISIKQKISAGESPADVQTPDQKIGGAPTLTRSG